MPSPSKRNCDRLSVTAKRKAKQRKHDDLLNSGAHVEDSEVHAADMETRIAFRYCPNKHYETISDIGSMYECSLCTAKKWKNETAAFCCNNGSVQLPKLKKLPVLLENLLTGNDSRAKPFLDQTRSYNNLFCMTSIGCEEIREGYMPTFKICGKLYHRIGSLLPSTNNTAQFLQIYFIGESEEETKVRQSYNCKVDKNLVKELQTMMHENNHYVKALKTIHDKIVNCNNIHEIKIAIKEQKIPDVHKRRTNVPTTNEIAIVMKGEEYGNRDIIIEGRDGILRRVTEIHRSYDPLQYPLLFPFGCDGYSIDVKQSNGKTSLSAMLFYRYRLMIRDENYLLLFRDLLNMYVVDMFAKIESERLLYLSLNQTKLRCEDYSYLRDALNTDTSDNIGKIVVLPSSFTGGSRYMNEKAQDGLTYVRKFGTADLFITFTCNPKWDDITKAILNQQQPMHRYDIITRVFKLKLAALMRAIQKLEIFGKVKCFMCSIEWQKRGLPHAHLLIWLETKIKSDEIDNIISAELPDPSKNPKLFDIVKHHMIHGPCGKLNRTAPCMEEVSCTKRYPRQFISETQHDRDGYPLYRRRSPQEGGFTTEINGITIDNTWIVPYNPVLSQAFNAHINVEFCQSVKSVKYICKYICKGSDLATVSLKYNEIEKYINGRYISTSEAFWRIFGFNIHDHSPAIVHLSVHLENRQRVYFNQQNISQKANNPPATTLTEYFKLCAVDKLAKTLFYEQIPSYFTWSGKTFSKRKQGVNVDGFPGYYKTNTLGRVYTVHPSQTECFYLRMLLFHVKGPTSFDDLKKYDGVIYQTFKEACNARGLLENDEQWKLTMKDAVLTKHPNSIRQLFALILSYCHVAEPFNLYELFKTDMAEDILYQYRKNCPKAEYNENIFNELLLRLNKQIQMMTNGKTVVDYGLPQPKAEHLEVSIEYLRETNYDKADLKNYIIEFEPKLNTEQKYVYQTVLQSISDNKKKLFYLDAPGGTGKTFLMNLLLAKVRSTGGIALAVASSGIAATLLHGGRTVHSTFKVPVNTFNCKSCNISKQSGLAKLIKKCDLIIWDECSMSHKSTLEAINTSVQDIRNNSDIMGGITVLFGGDFRQTLPVIERGTRADTVHATLKYCKIWEHVQLLPPLRKNMRLSESSQQYAAMLLDIGNGTFQNQNGNIEIESFANLVASRKDLINHVWPNIDHIANQPLNFISERAILAPLNSIADDLNEEMLNNVKGEEIVYYSLDTVLNEEDSTNYPIEFLNSLSPRGLPPHQLKLKIGVPIMLLRNLEPPKLCNGTRLIVTRLMRNLIQATILTGVSAGESVLLPRIPLIPSDLPFSFKRLQFPLKMCFALTVNKSQGQTFNTVGVDLTEDCFSHGQLYVAVSRVSKANQLYIHCNHKTTKNIVFSEVF